MKFKRIIYHEVVFPKRYHLLGFKLAFKSCANLSGRGSVESQEEGHRL